MILCVQYEDDRAAVSCAPLLYIILYAVYHVILLRRDIGVDYGLRHISSADEMISLRR